MSLIYKTLFEVKLMHQFYLTDKEGKSVFALADQKDRLQFLLQQYSKDEDSINQDVLFEFPKQLLSQYESYNLKLLSTYSGFKVAVRVNQKNLPDKSVVYLPLIPLPDDLSIYISVIKKNDMIDSYTNSSLMRSFSSIFFFSNNNIQGAKSFPFLTNNINAFNSINSYGQGELTSFGVNDIREYYKNELGDQWSPVTGSAFANENDRLLLPVKFQYLFNGNADINNANFILKDGNGNTIKEISISNTNSITKALLDFSDKADIISVSETSAPDKIFSLEVSGNNYSANYKVIFSDNLYNRENWGTIHITVKPANPSFNLSADDGFLIKRKSPLGVFTDAPVFEIPVTSSFTYWRYINNRGKEIKLIPDYIDYLFKEDKVLLSIKPRAVSKYYFLLQKEGSSDTTYVPNPNNYELKKDSKDRLCFDIRIPESQLFPIIP